MPPRACVVPVGAAEALAWLAGELHDVDLLLAAPLVPEAVFVVNLPNRASYRDCLQQILHWRRCGAKFVIARSNGIVLAHLCGKNSGQQTFQEPYLAANPQHRFVLPPQAFDAWLGKFSRALTPDSALAAGAAR